MSKCFFKISSARYMQYLFHEMASIKWSVSFTCLHYVCCRRLWHLQWVDVRFCNTMQSYHVCPPFSCKVHRQGHGCFLRGNLRVSLLYDVNCRQLCHSHIFYFNLMRTTCWLVKINILWIFEPITKSIRNIIGVNIVVMQHLQSLMLIGITNEDSVLRTKSFC